MAKKGQTCRTCDGTCCRLQLQYVYPAGFAELKNFMYEITQARARAAGFKEVMPNVSERHNCSQLTPKGKCRVHGKDKPLLCRSYWCGGKWWSPKGVRLDVLPGEVTVGGKRHVETALPQAIPIEA